MSKRRSKQSSTEPAATAATADETFNEPAFEAEADSRDEAVEELDDALDALPGGDDEDGAGEEDDNPLARIDVSGETSFGSVEFEEEDEEEDEEDEDEAEDEDDSDPTDDEASDDEKAEYAVFDADAEDRAEEFERMRAQAASATLADGESADDEIAPGGQPRELVELVSICEALVFVSEEPISVKTLADILKEDKGWVQVAVDELAKEFNERGGGLMLREVAGGWQFATRPEYHEHVRAYLKSKPSAKLSLAALETLAVIAYKQPVTVPEILEIRGVQSSSAIKTLLDKRLIVAKGRKETVGRPMMYGTSKDFLLQFGLRDLSELPNVEDFEDLAGGGARSDAEASVEGLEQVGLAICVGIPSEVRESEPEYAEYFGRQMDAVNDILVSYGLPEHAEPFDIEDERTVEFDMLGYGGLHYLRRLAAHLALKGELPPPGEGDAASDSVLNDYYRIFDASFARGEAAAMPFQHLIVHGDAEGYYLPVEFEEVIIPDASLEIAGGMLGSSHTLLRECRELARQLELPEGFSPDDEAFDAPFDEQGLGDAKWEQYRVESYICLGLIAACEASIETGAAVVFE